MNHKKKSDINFIIDGIMFLLMGLLTGIGFLIKYVLIHGEDRWIRYGKNVDMHFLGIDRHGWGKMHLYVAIVLIAFLFLHILLHWKLTVCLFKNLFKKKSFRAPVVIIFIVLTIMLTIFPFLIQPKISDLAPGRERFKQYTKPVTIDSLSIPDTLKKMESPSLITVDEKHKDQHHQIDSTIEVKGFYTLSEVSNKYDVPCDLIKSKLNIPSSVPNSSKLGHLRKQYGFSMSDIELIIHNYKNN